jgi:hypothetical protein
MGRAVGAVATVDPVAFAAGAKETISEAEVSEARANARGRDPNIVMLLVKWGVIFLGNGRDTHSFGGVAMRIVTESPPTIVSDTVGMSDCDEGCSATLR